IQRYKKNGTCTNENFPPKMVWPGAGVLLAMAYGLPYLGITLSGLPMVMLIVLVLALGVFSGIRLTQFTDYRQMYQKLLKEKKGGMTVREMMKATQEEESRKRIVAGGVVSTKKKGFAYFNGLFVQRHRKSLYQSAYKIAGVFSLVFVGAAIALQIFPEVREIVNQQIVTSLPIFLFLMFAINRGMAFTQLLFMNCDHSMLTYSFYKNASNCLTLFRLRLLENIKINLFPAVIIGGGLPLLLYLSGGTAALSSYILLPVCIIAMSVFFSVHHLVCYYLLQPYNVDLEQKSKTYSIVTWVTYMLCYFMMKQKLVIAEFALWVVIFALVYCVVACVLVYKLAPRTFRLRV
ncbi:MAG: hypothetical protein RR626_05720, partial [Anaerovoracaceae bacterium]